MDGAVKFNHTYKIGRKTDRGDGTQNDVVLAFGDVSSCHARLTCLSEQVFLLEDENSTNGTFVNGIRYQRAICSREDSVSLANHLLDLNELFPIAQLQASFRDEHNIAEVAPAQKINPLDFTAEFAELGNYCNFFKQQKTLLLKKQNNGGFLRLIPTAVLGALGLIIGHGTFMFTTLASSVGGLIGMVLSNALSPVEKLAALEEEYKIKYTCPNPKCLLPFNQTPWEVLARKQVCDRCKAIWVA